MKTHSLTQCRLAKRLDETTTVEQMAYIPTKYAIQGQVVKIKNDDDEWVDSWQVIGVYGTVDDVVPARQSRKRHRKNTGDSLPKEQ